MKQQIWFFVITSVLLILFQIGIYMKACAIPNFISWNMIFLYIALVIPIIITKIKNKLIIQILFSLYLIYLIIVLVGFINMMIDLNINCTGATYIDIADLINA